MKRYILFILCFVPFALTGQTLKIDKLFAKFADSKYVETVEISKSLFSSLKGTASNNLLNNLSSLKILNIEYEKNTEKERIAGELKTEINEILSKDGYEKLITVNSSGDKVNIYLSTGEPKHIIVLSQSDNELTFMNITGNITQSVITDIIKGDISIK